MTRQKAQLTCKHDNSDTVERNGVLSCRSEIGGTVSRVSYRFREQGLRGTTRQGWAVAPASRVHRDHKWCEGRRRRP